MKAIIVTLAFLLAYFDAVQYNPIKQKPKLKGLSLMYRPPQIQKAQLIYGDNWKLERYHNLVRYRWGCDEIRPT